MSQVKTDQCSEDYPKKDDKAVPYPAENKDPGGVLIPGMIFL